MNTICKKCGTKGVCDCYNPKYTPITNTIRTLLIASARTIKSAHVVCARPSQQ